MTGEPTRLLAAALVLLLYAALCGATGLARRRRRQQAERESAALLPAAADARPVLVGYASQTGLAEQLAWQTARALHTAGMPARLLPLGQVTAAELAGARHALFIASSYGEGDPPDAAAAFARHVMAAEPPLSLQGLRHATLALGDRQYTHYCGFGRRLDAWLHERGATPLFERIDVDNADPQALTQWRHQLSRLAGLAESADWGPVEAPFEAWQLVLRRHLNPGSSGSPVYHLELRPPADVPLPEWQAGDLVQVLAPGDRTRPREYSIASLPAEGGVQLLVRQERHDDGTLGLASGWLTRELEPGGTVELRLRAHTNFRAGVNMQRRMILIGNGTGLAGLRGHLMAREQARAPGAWLVHGERRAAHDRYYADDITRWLQRGVLEHADLVFSRDQPQRRYVQHRLLECAEALRTWIAEGAAVYVCGSLTGMAEGVDEALAQVLGRAALEALAEGGRYRRDVY